MVVIEEEQEEEAAYLTALEDATRRAIEESELQEMATWPGLAQALAESAAGVEANTPSLLPPPAPPAPEAWRSISWMSTMPVDVSCTPLSAGRDRRGGAAAHLRHRDACVGSVRSAVAGPAGACMRCQMQRSRQRRWQPSRWLSHGWRRRIIDLNEEEEDADT